MRFSFAIFLRGFGAHARSETNTAHRECGDRPAATNSVTRTCTTPWISLYSAHDEIFMLHLSRDFRHRFNDHRQFHWREVKISIKYASYLAHVI